MEAQILMRRRRSPFGRSPAGAKFLTKNNLIGEVSGGVGRVFGDNSLGAYPRFGLFRQKILTTIKIKIKTTTLFLNEKVFYIFDEYFTDFL